MQAEIVGPSNLKSRSSNFVAGVSTVMPKCPGDA